MMKRLKRTTEKASKSSAALIIFWALVIVGLFILGQLFIPAIRNLLGGSLLFLLPSVLFSLLGLALIIVVMKQKTGGPLKKFLLLTGISSLGFFVSIFLHNLIYALFVYWLGTDFWERIGLGDEPLFFILATLVCPILFLVGVVGSLILLARKKI